MAYKDLREFIDALEKGGELVRIKAPVGAEFEITEITDRVSKGTPAQNRALLFENVVGCDIPVLINMFGSARRMSMALGVSELDEAGRKIESLLEVKPPASVGDALAKGAELLGALRGVGLKPRTVKRAPVQEVVEAEAPRLSDLPILKCWPGDGGRYVTLPTVITRDPVTGTRNVGMYRLQVHDERTLGMHWQIHKGGAEHHQKARRLGQPVIPVAVSLGGDPAVIWSGSAPLPHGIDEFLLAGWLRGKPVELVRCVSQPIEAPANAEIVIEGYVDPAESAPEGPFGDHTGFYTPVEDYPVMHVTAITRRERPIYPATVVGIPPMEDYWMGKATERLFLPLMRLFLGEIVDVSMPAEGVFHNLALVSIRKRYPGHARKVINGLWGLGLMSLTKCIVVFDEDVDVQNPREAMFHALGSVDWARDVVIQEGPTDALDHASYRPAFGGKIGIDATAKTPAEGYTREWPAPVSMSDEVKRRIDRIWDDLGI